MKIKDIYMNKQKCVVSLCIAVLCIAITLVSFVFPDKYNALAYAYPMRYPWQIFSGLFLHGAPNLSQVGSVGHLLFNLFLVLPFGVMIEKILGSKRFLSGTICFWCTNIPSRSLADVDHPYFGKTRFKIRHTITQLILRCLDKAKIVSAFHPFNE